MKGKAIIYNLLLIGIGVSIGFTYHFFMKTLEFNVSIHSEEKISDYDYHFVLIVQEEIPYFIDLYNGAQEAATKNKIYLEFLHTNQTNIEDQINLIEMAIASKVDGIITQGLSNEFLPVVKKANDKEIPLIIVDSNFENNNLITYVGSDNYQAGYEVGLAVREATVDETKVGILTGSFVANNLNERVRGFQDAIEQENRIEIVSIESSNLNKIQGAEKTYQMLRKHPDISVFFGTSALDSLGIANGVNKFSPEKPIQIYAFDKMDGTDELLDNGVLQAIVKQEPYQMGYKGVELLVEVMKGNEIEKEYYTPTTILRKEAENR